MALAIVSTATTSIDPSSTSHTVNLPASIVAGNLLVIECFENVASLTVTASGWTNIGSANSTSDGLVLLAKIATGAEGATVAVTTSSSVRATYIARQISGNQNDVTTSEIAVGTGSTAVSTTPDPPSLTPSWGSAENLWFAFAGWNSTSTTLSSYPSGYSTSQLTKVGSGLGANSCASAAKLATASSDDPGTFTLSASQTWIGMTYAVRPALEAKAPPPHKFDYQPFLAR